MDTSNVFLAQRLVIFVFSLSVGALISYIAWRKGFYRLEPSTNASPIKLSDVVKIFVLFLTVELVVVPFFYTFWSAWEQGLSFFSKDLDIDANGRTWLNVWGAFFTAVAFVVFLRIMDPRKRDAILGSQDSKKSILTKIGYYLFGAATWFIVYPLLIAAGQLLEIVVNYINSNPHVDQIAVKHLKGVLDNPQLFWLMAATVVFVIPFIEEFLFRGVLQTWLKNKMSVGKAIALTSAIFALFHFSPDQKIENIELLASLFFLSCYLGLLKEKKQSLWASIGLHSTFNGISVLILYAS
ncbi:MAG: CPBP family intramembrane glutamic endopeptidase [Parachlamydiaceae bacterium]